MNIRIIIHDLDFRFFFFNQHVGMIAFVQFLYKTCTSMRIPTDNIIVDCRIEDPSISILDFKKGMLWFYYNVVILILNNLWTFKFHI